MTVPISRIPQLVKGIEEIGLRHQVDIFNLGHAGDGNLHPDILFEGESQDELERVENAAREIFELAVKLGGTLTGEHGIGLGKARFMTLEHDAVAMNVMNAIKNLLDPNRILNPGKMGLDA